MSSIFLFVVSIILTFTALVASDKLFGKNGVIAWMCVATLTANILVCKSVDMLGFTCSLGNVMFASVFLATDLINEKYGAELSRKGVFMAVWFQVFFIVVMQIALAYQPAATDIADASMQSLFAINLRTSIASIAMFGISNLLGIWIHQSIKRKIADKMWLRNNVSTMVSNSLENFAFVFLAFWGLMEPSVILSIAITTTVIECFVALCDTPFLYWACRNNPKAVIKWRRWADRRRK